MTPGKQAILTALEALALSMRKEGVWPSTSPSNEALNSTVPFAVDAMDFESWLAFIFIPKMSQLIHSDAALPEMEITPAARLYLEDRSTSIIKQIAAIDGLVQTARVEQGMAQ